MQHVQNAGKADESRRLSDLLGRPVADSGGEPLGRLTDVIVRLSGADYPRTGRDPAAKRVLLPAAPLQRPRSARPVDEPPMAEHRGGGIVGALVALSGTLVITTRFSSLNSARTALWLAAGLIAGALIYVAYLRLTRARRSPSEPHPRTTMTSAERLNWRMPPLALLKPVQWTAGTRLGMLMQRGYLVVSVVLLVVKAVGLGSAK